MTWVCLSFSSARIINHRHSSAHSKSFARQQWITRKNPSGSCVKDNSVGRPHQREAYGQKVVGEQRM